MNVDGIIRVIDVTLGIYGTYQFQTQEERKALRQLVFYIWTNGRADLDMAYHIFVNSLRESGQSRADHDYIVDAFQYTSESFQKDFSLVYQIARTITSLR